jgi:hypothetical protein
MDAPMDRLRRASASLLVIAIAAAVVGGVGGCAALDQATQQGARSTRNATVSSGSGAGSAQSAAGVMKGSAPGVPASGEPLSANTAASPPVTAGGSVAPGPQRMVVRDSTLRLRVTDVAASAKKITLLTQAAGGYIESMQLASDTGGSVIPPQPVPMAGAGITSQQGVSPSGAPVLSGFVRVRIPAGKLAAFTRDVSSLGEVVYRSTDAQDVTAQHVDMVARLKNLQSAEADLRRLSARANTVSEVLAVQRELTRVQGEIESLQAQIALLDSQAALAAVTVQLVGPEAIVTPAGDSWGFIEALRTSIRAFVGTVNVLIVALGALLPIIIIFALLAWLVWWLVRRSNRRHAARLAAEAETSGTEVVTSDAVANEAGDGPGEEPCAR